MEAEIQNALKALQHASSDTGDAVTGFFFFLFIYFFQPVAKHLYVMHARIATCTLLPL
jgi:hypothetical protein